MKNKIIYSLNIEDLQYVAQQGIGRELSTKGITKLKPIVDGKINLYNAISDSIYEATFLSMKLSKIN